MSTHPSRYFERQAPANDDVVIEYSDTRIEGGEAIMMLLGMVVCGFALGMIVTAACMGVL